MSYPEHILKMVRKRWGLAENDTSRDAGINKMEPDRVFYEILNWNGLLGGWDFTISEWVKDIYGVDLHEISERVGAE